jgi:hypothetical protein
MKRVSMRSKSEKEKKEDPEKNEKKKPITIAHEKNIPERA